MRKTLQGQVLRLPAPRGPVPPRPALGGLPGRPLLLGGGRLVGPEPARGHGRGEREDHLPGHGGGGRGGGALQGGDQGMAVAWSKIKLFFFSKKKTLLPPQIVDLGGLAVLPGFHDVHMHPLEVGSPVGGTCRVSLIQQFSLWSLQNLFSSGFASRQSPSPVSLEWRCLATSSVSGFPARPSLSSYSRFHYHTCEIPRLDFQEVFSVGEGSACPLESHVVIIWYIARDRLSVVRTTWRIPPTVWNENSVRTTRAPYDNGPRQ